MTEVAQGFDPLGIGASFNLFQKLRRGRFDLTIDLQGLLRSALMTAATKAKVRVGLADAREGARWFYTDAIDAPRLGLHAVERIQRVAGALRCRRLETAVQPADPRSRPSVGQGDAGGSAVAQDRAQCGSTMGDQALAARSFRRDRPPRRSRI